jgi:hypothetical protein
MARQYSRRLALALVLPTLAGCTAVDNFLAHDVDRTAPLGRFIDRPAPQVPVTKGGPNGVLIGGPVAPEVPEAAIDQVVGANLRTWLTLEERRSLAVASETAAYSTGGLKVEWQAKDGSSAVTATGSATAIGDVYRSRRGEVCRDVFQRFEKSAVEHEQTITLCREAQAAGIPMWLIGTAD